eukprot:1193124-Amphidinium_carterae.2
MPGYFCSLFAIGFNASLFGMHQTRVCWGIDRCKLGVRNTGTLLRCAQAYTWAGYQVTADNHITQLLK